MKTLDIFINDQVVYEYDKEAALDEQKLAFFNNMDADMKKGIKVQGELITSPDQNQRAKFVVMNLIKALQQDNDAVIAASCAYLVNRLPALIEVHTNDQGSAINIEFVDEH